jgi:hypothetical protein
MYGNLLPDSHLTADMVYNYEGAHILITLVRRIPKTWKNGHCLYNGPAARWRIEHSGTVVHLRDIFHNVRRTAMSASQDI